MRAAVALELDTSSRARHTVQGSNSPQPELYVFFSFFSNADNGCHNQQLTCGNNVNSY